MRTADLTKEQHSLLLRISHGSLYVPAFLGHIRDIRVLAPGDALCLHPDCAAAEQRPLDGLTHAFLQCPAVVPAASWVCHVFAAVSRGAPPPLCPRVLLGGESAVWDPGTALRHLWTHLRMAYLHAVWQLRASHAVSGQPITPTAICSAVVATVAAAIRRDHTRATRNMRQLDGTYAAWIRRRDVSITNDTFLRRWAHGGVLCHLDGTRLHLHFSLGYPVPFLDAAPQQEA
jgi:hypothetical protein